MVTLTPEECRVLAVLVEKAHTTPQQYPLTLNALVLGCNQKNNRDPVMNLTEERVYDAVDSLREKGFVREALLSGSRVAKFRHVARETLGIETPQLVVLTELMLRGPQSAAEVRANASRMHPIESNESCQAVLDSLINRPEPMVKSLPGGRATRFAQLLAPAAHRLDAAASDSEELEGPPAHSTSGSTSLAARVTALEAEVARLTEMVQRLAAALGEPTTPKP